MNSRFSVFFLLALALHLSIFLRLDSTPLNTPIMGTTEVDIGVVEVRLTNEQAAHLSPATVIAKPLQKKSLDKQGKKDLSFEKSKSHSLLDPYMAQIRSKINQLKSYPRMAKRLRHQGFLKVELWLNDKGEIISKKYLEQTESSLLNRATDKIFSRIQSFGTLPKEITQRPLRVIVPISYLLDY